MATQLQHLNLLTVRDPVSREYVLRHFPGVDVRYIPDALFTWKEKLDAIPPITNGRVVLPHGQEHDSDFERFDFTGSYICISGSSLAAWNQEAAYQSYKRLVLEIKKQIEIPVFLMQVCSGDRFLLRVADDLDVPCMSVDVPIMAGAKILANASLYISGRFHPSIMASLGGTPCVFLGSNSHKTLSLQDVLEYGDVLEYSANPTVDEISEIIAEAIRKLRQGDAHRARIRSVAAKRAGEAEAVLHLLT